MRTTVLSALFVFALLPALPAQEPARVSLEWKLKKGDKHRYEVGQVMEIDFGGTEITMDMLFGLAMDVTDVSADGVAKIKTTYDRVRVSMAGPLASEYDSDKDTKADDADVLGRILAGLLNRSFTMDLSRKGECLKTEGLTKLIEEAAKSVPDDAPMAAQIIPELKKQYGDESMKGVFQTLLGFLPKTPIAAGETWKAKHSVTDALGTLAIDATCTLKELRSEGSQAVIKTDGKVVVTPPEGGGVFGAMEIDESKMKSEVIWKVADGLLESSTGTFTVDGTAGGMDVSILQKFSLKLAPKKK